MKPTRLTVDAHVHIHDCFDLSAFLRAAVSNFLQVSREYPTDSPCVPVLMLTESRGQRMFRRLSEGTRNGECRIDGDGKGEYRVMATKEAESLRVQGEDGTFLFLIAGLQIATAERMEVLALGTVAEIPDGSPLEEAVAAVIREGAFAVIPWGFGKWSGRRGNILRRFLANPPAHGFFLGDNGGRTAWLPMSRLFALGRKKGVRILPGSDPLPFPSEEHRPGSFGSTLYAPFEDDRPLQAIRTALAKTSDEPEPYGELLSPIRFVRNQVAMQIAGIQKSKDRKIN